MKTRCRLCCGLKCKITPTCGAPLNPAGTLRSLAKNRIRWGRVSRQTMTPLERPCPIVQSMIWLDFMLGSPLRAISQPERCMV
jgi:hypothetical protein